jgi:GR25 family glycosyltransferase involved in LPS biosynthesis
MKAIVINLDRDQEKWETVKGKFRDQGVELTRLSATDGAQLLKSPGEKLTPLCKWFCTPKMAGCFDSHKRIWQKVKDENLPYVLVLEDDTCPTPQFKNLLPKVMREVPNDWDILYLGCHLFDVSVPRESGDTWSTSLTVQFLNMLGLAREHKKVSDHIHIPRILGGAHAYVISTSGAKKLVEKFPRINFSNDVVVNYEFDLNIYCTDPPLAIVNENVTPKGSQITWDWLFHDQVISVCVGVLFLTNIWFI